jgi:hypothetical protein
MSPWRWKTLGIFETAAIQIISVWYNYMGTGLYDKNPPYNCPISPSFVTKL